MLLQEAALPPSARLHTTSNTFNKNSLIQRNTACPVALILQSRRAGGQGFGARLQFLLAATDVALHLRATLSLDSHYWSADIHHAKLSPYHHFRNDYRWAWHWFGIPRWDPRSNTSGTARLDGLTMASVLPKVDLVMGGWSCGRAYSINTHYPDSCYGVWCFELMPGVIDRVYAPIVAASSALSSLPVTVNTSVPALVVWHLRTGDISLPLERDGVARLRDMIDAGFPLRRTRHLVLTSAPEGLGTIAPWLRTVLPSAEVLQDTRRALRPIALPVSAEAKEEHAWLTMLTADVVISTGSSFPVSATSFAPLGRQIHLYGPPKQTLMRICYNSSSWLQDMWDQTLNLKAKKSPLTYSVQSANRFALRTASDWKSSFSRKNSIPMDCKGAMFPEYLYKFTSMLQGLDTNGLADPDIANLHYELWM